MELNPAAFNDFIDGIGETFLWRPSFACACLNPSSGAPKANCPVCGGMGRIWSAAVSGTCGVCSSGTQLQWAKMGQYEAGDLVLIIAENSPIYEISQFDRLVTTSSTDNFSMPLVRGAPTERVYGSVKEFTRVFWFDDQFAIVEGAMPVIDAQGRLSWPNGGAPPAGKAYSLTGVRNTEYFCFGQYSSDRMKHHGARLPRKMVMRRFDLFGRSSKAA